MHEQLVAQEDARMLSVNPRRIVATVSNFVHSTISVLLIPFAISGITASGHSANHSPNEPLDLLSVVLSTVDLEPGWTEIGPPILTSDGGVVAVFFDIMAGRGLTVNLFRAELTTPRAAVEQSLRFSGTFGGPTVVGEDVVPPALGEDTIRQRLTISLGPVTTYGDLLAWRRGSTVAVVQFLGPPPADALPYAELQDRKLPH